MTRKQRVFKMCSIAAVLMLGVASVASPQVRTTEPSDPHIVTESFDGNDPSLILGGQLDLRQNSSPWVLYLADGKLVMENRQEPDSLHYRDIAWVKYPGTGLIESTAGSVISAVVHGNAVATGGVGILVGSGKQSSYLMFSVDGQGRYHLLKKDGRELRPVHSEVHEAVLVGQPSTLSYSVLAANIAFLVNGVQVVQIEAPNRMPGSRRIDGRSGVGIAAFGIGKYFIESVEISKGS